MVQDTLTGGDGLLCDDLLQQSGERGDNSSGCGQPNICVRLPCASASISRTFYLAEKDQCRGWRLWWSYPRRPSDLPVRLFSMGHLLQQKGALRPPVLTKLLLLTVILFRVVFFLFSVLLYLSLIRFRLSKVKKFENRKSRLSKIESHRSADSGHIYDFRKSKVWTFDLFRIYRRQSFSHK